jgi:hypothetical protein
MIDLEQLAAKVAKREITRKEFLVLTGGSFLGMISIFRVLQNLNTPELVNSDKGVFGEHEYGHPDPVEVAKVKAKGFSQDVFG